MSFIADRVKMDGLTFDDVLLIPAYSEVLPKDVNLTTRFSRNITPNGRFLLCCCRDSNKIQVFRRDESTGLLIDTFQDISLSKPVCVQFLDSNHNAYNR